MSEQMEYLISQTGEHDYEVAKFSSMSGGEQPLSVYHVRYNPSRNQGKCDCPAGSYRGTGMQDKHVQMVIRWLREGRPLTMLAESGTGIPRKARFKEGG